MTDKLEALKAAALAATPGPWYRSSVLFNGVTSEQALMHQGDKPHIARMSEKRDAIFIAQANPTTVLELLAALEEKDRRIAELEAGHSEAAKQINSWRNLAKQNIAEREKDIAALDAARQRNAELEREKTNIAMLCADTCAKAKQKHDELEQRLQQPIKLPKSGIGMACKFVGDQIVVSLAAVLVETAMAGFKAEVEGE